MKRPLCNTGALRKEPGKDMVRKEYLRDVRDKLWESVLTLATCKGGLAERVDSAYARVWHFVPEHMPDLVRPDVEQLHELMSTADPVLFQTDSAGQRHYEGRVEATIRGMHWAKARKIAKLICSIHEQVTIAALDEK